MRRAGAALSAVIVAGLGAAESATAAADAPTVDDGLPPDGRHLRATLLEPTSLRATPGGEPVAELNTRTEFGSRTVLAVTARRRGWIQVISARLKNGRRGWLPAKAVRLESTAYSIAVDRSERRLELRRGTRAVRSVSVGVGRPGSPTPLGTFAITDKLTPSNPRSTYGCCILALSGRQPRVPADWPGGDRLAIHGSPAPEARGATIGCVSARAADLKALLRVVPLGTPVVIRA